LSMTCVAVAPSKHASCTGRNAATARAGEYLEWNRFGWRHRPWDHRSLSNSVNCLDLIIGMFKHAQIPNCLKIQAGSYLLARDAFWLFNPAHPGQKTFLFSLS
jgi:hypothetical protein